MNLWQKLVVLWLVAPIAGCALWVSAIELKLWADHRKRVRTRKR